VREFGFENPAADAAMESFTRLTRVG